MARAAKGDCSTNLAQHPGHLLPLLTRQRNGHNNQCGWGAWTQDFKEEAIYPDPSFCISPAFIQTTPLNSIDSEMTGVWKWWKGSCGSSYEIEIEPSATDIIFFSFSENASLFPFICSLKTQPCYSRSFQTALGGRFHSRMCSLQEVHLWFQHSRWSLLTRPFYLKT